MLGKNYVAVISLLNDAMKPKWVLRLLQLVDYVLMLAQVIKQFQQKLKERCRRKQL